MQQQQILMAQKQQQQRQQIQIQQQQQLQLRVAQQMQQRQIQQQQQLMMQQQQQQNINNAQNVAKIQHIINMIVANKSAFCGNKIRSTQHALHHVTNCSKCMKTLEQFKGTVFK